MQAARRLFVGGNWKSNGTVASVTELVNQVYGKLHFNPAKVEVLVAPVSIHLPLVKQLLRSDILLSSQNVSLYGQGAYTGEIAAEQLKDLGVLWTIIGHSERRTLFGDSDGIVAKKVEAALGKDLSVIACIGENLQERERNVTSQVVIRQLEAIRSTVTDWSKIVLAYEPVWAIGTGKTATSQQAQEVHETIRNWLKTRVSAEAAASTRIIYGGSVTDKNAQELISSPDVDGFLVGGASLKPAIKDIIAACDS